MFNTFDTLEERLEGYIDKTPLIAKMLFSYEIRNVRTCLNESRRLRQEYAPTEAWYTAYSNNLNFGFNAIYNATDRMYSLYDGIRNIPLIGNLISPIFDRYITSSVANVMPKEFNITAQTENAVIRLPQRQTTLNVLQNVYSLAREGAYAHYEATTNNSADRIRRNTPNKLTNYDADPSPFRKALTDTFESIGNFFGEMFGTRNYSTTYA